MIPGDYRHITLPLLLAATFGSGCAEPDLGVIPFFCNTGQPECPEGYVCRTRGAERVCLKEGLGRRRPPDGGPSGDAGRRDAAPPAPTIIISEIMARPQAVGTTVGEWIELFNVSTKQVDLAGWTLSDKSGEKHKLAPAGGKLLLPGRGFVVLGRSTDAKVNGGVVVDYAYKGFNLDDAADAIILEDAAGKVVDQVSYSVARGFPLADGASMSVPNPLKDNDQGSAWCQETRPWKGSAGDKGTPRAPPGCR